MKILHFGTLDSNAGGPAMSLYNTLLGLKSAGVEAEVLSYPLSENSRLVFEKFPLHFAEKPLENKFGYSPKLIAKIKKLGIYNVYHAQGVWQYPTYAMASFARKNKKPYLISPRGMLYPQDIAKASTIFKKLSLKFKLLSDLNQAACVHATCEEEMTHLRNLGVTSPIAVLPNPIEIKEYAYQKQDEIFRLGYLGRISKRKNVESLFYAWQYLGDKAENAELLIIGGGDFEYEAFLKNEVKRLDLQNVQFTGFIRGEEKDKALASLSVLVMPSEFENFGNVVVEALLRKIPCIATKGAPWHELETYHCGWWVDYNQEAINKAIVEALRKSPEELQQMGERGRELVENYYSNQAIGLKMKELYEWVLGKAEKPNFVYLK